MKGQLRKPDPAHAIIKIMSGDRNPFDELPEDIRQLIKEFVEKSTDLAKASLVSKKWHALFSPKLDLLHFLDFLSSDEDVCKKINIEQLRISVNMYLFDINVSFNIHKDQAKYNEQLIDLFVALKKLERHIIDFENDENHQWEMDKLLKIRSKEMQNFLMGEFGLAALIHSTTNVMFYTLSIKFEDVIPLLALEKSMQLDSKKNQFTLDLINAFVDRVGYLWPNKALAEAHKDDGRFIFDKNQLKIVWFAGIVPLSKFIEKNWISMESVPEKINELLEEIKLSKAKSDSPGQRSKK